MYDYVFFLMLAFMVFDYLFRLIVKQLNAGRFSRPVPPELQGIFDAAEYDMQQRYLKESHRFSTLSSGVSFAVLLVLFCTGFFGLLDGWLRGATEAEIPLALLYFLILGAGSELLSLPFDYYSTFVIEEKYGFNKSTRGLFFADELKSCLVGAIIGGGLLALVAWLYSLSPDWFWLMAWGAVALISIFLNMFYSQLIVPLFNKQTPLAEGELRDAIQDFAAEAGFKLDNIYVIDGSKRSSKANAYFSGLGSKKRVVLYDTLISQMSTREIVAVLAHEIGHYKKKHTLKHLLFSLASNLLMLFLLGLCVGSPELSRAMGAAEPSFHVGLLAFTLLYSPVSLAMGIAMNAYSRRHEYEADAFAREHGLADELVSGLKKLTANNLSNLQPHPAYVFVFYSHPTLLQRMNALKK